MSVLARLTADPRRRGAVAICVAALAISVAAMASLVFAHQPAQARVMASDGHLARNPAGNTAGNTPGKMVKKPRTKGTLLVIGDSLARIFNDKPGSPRQGFWSMVSREVGGQPKVVAQGGAGFVKPGLSRCKGLNFGQQLARPSIQRKVMLADAVIIEGGRNDTRTCHKRGFRDISTSELRATVDATLDQVEALRGSTDDCTIVITPWGPKGTDERARITPVIRDETRAHGFTFVDTVGLLTERTSAADGVHPNRAGSIALSRAILQDSYAEACFY